MYCLLFFLLIHRWHFWGLWHFRSLVLPGHMAYANIISSHPSWFLPKAIRRLSWIILAILGSLWTILKFIFIILLWLKLFFFYFFISMSTLLNLFIYIYIICWIIKRTVTSLYQLPIEINQPANDPQFCLKIQRNTCAKFHVDIE